MSSQARLRDAPFVLPPSHCFYGSMHYASGDPLHNTARLRALHDTELLDTAADAAFDRFAQLSADLLKAPVSLVTLVDEHRQFFKSCIGLSEPWATRRETPLSHSFCQHVVRSDAPLVVEFAPDHPLVKDNLAIRDLGVISYIGVPIRLTNGHVLGSLCVIDSMPRAWTTHDVSILERLSELVVTEVELRRQMQEQRRAEQSRHESEQIKRAVFDGSLDAIVTIDSHGAVTEFNSAAERIFGMSRGRVMGQPMGDLIVPMRHRAAHHAGMARYLASGVSRVLGRRLEMTALRADGTEFPVELSIVQLAVEGEPRFTAFMRDITEARAAADAVVRARDVAEAANRAKDDFLGRVSHELRTPLHAVLGFTELINSGSLGAVNEQMEDVLGDVLSSARHLLAIVNDLLNISGISAGKVSLAPAPLDLRHAVEEVADAMRHIAGRRAIRISVDVDDAVRAVIIDATRLREILTNYASNAIRYSPPGGVVQVRVRPAPFEQFRIEVQDDGKGIPREMQARLFQPFSRIEENGDTESTGLGLAVTRLLAEAQGGTVGVRSAAGAGATFFVELPMRPLAPT